MTSREASIRSGRGDAVPLLASFATAILFNILIIATPGFYSHDEWNRLDEIEARGFIEYVRAFGSVHAGPSLGHPVRPVGFLQQGVSALWMEYAPVVPHLFDVAMHGAIAAAFSLLILSAGGGRRLAALSGIAFAVSPLATLATGWLGASFDRWYSLFSTVALLAFVAIVKRGWSAPRAIALLLAASFAMLSKETAAVLPLAILIFALFLRASNAEGALSNRTMALAFGIVTLPVVIYLAVRFPAVVATMQGQERAAYYLPAAAHVARNALHYFAFPFIVFHADPHISVVPKTELWAAVGAHGALVLALYRCFGPLRALFYLAGYFVFLLPVIALPNAAVIYLYGSAGATALATGALADRFLPERNRIALGLLAAGFCALTTHSLLIQWDVYRTGLCQARFIAGVDAVLARESPAGGGGLGIVAEEKRTGWIAKAAVLRKKYSGERGPRVDVAFHPDDLGKIAGVTRARMNAECRVR